MDAHQKSALLFLVGDGKPVLDQLDAGPRQHAFEVGHVAKKILDLRLGGEIHHPLDPGPVVPGPVEQNDFAGAGQMRHVALEVPLRLFAFAGRRQRHRAADAGVQALGDAFDDAPLAGRVAAFEDHRKLVTRMNNPVLQLDQLCLETEQFAEIVPPRHGIVTGDVSERLPRLLGNREIVDLEFELLVETVQDFGGNPVQFFTLDIAVRQASTRISVCFPTVAVSLR